VREVPQQFAARAWVEEAAEREVQPGVRRAVIADGCIRETRSAVATMKPVEEPDEVRAVEPFHSRAIRRRAGGRGDDARTCNRQPGVDARNVQDRLGLEVERRRILPEIRELDDARVRRTLDQEGLIALAAEIQKPLVRLGYVWVVITASCLNQQDADIRIFGESASDHRTR